jgi:hypothetical protein
MRLFLCVLLGLIAQAAWADDSDVLERGRELTRLFLEGKTEAVWSQMDPGMQRFITRSKHPLSAFYEQSKKEFGEESEVLSETVEKGVGSAIYERTSRWSKVDVPVVIRWEIGADGLIVGWAIHDQFADPEPAPTAFLDYVTKTVLHLPFKDEWQVYWGGRTAKQNIHIVQQQQRFAYDFALTKDGQMHKGDGEKLDDYYCWGAPILAPANGTIVSVVGDLPDRGIGSVDKPSSLAGNFIVLDMGNGEYALMAHLRQNSVRVKAGQHVEGGEQLGECGNSGNTSQPHLHFHVQNSPDFGKGDGLPAFFVDYMADGKPIAHGEPLRGQVIRSR